MVAMVAVAMGWGGEDEKREGTGSGSGSGSGSEAAVQWEKRKGIWDVEEGEGYQSSKVNYFCARELCYGHACLRPR